MDRRNFLDCRHRRLARPHAGSAGSQETGRAGREAKPSHRRSAQQAGDDLQPQRVEWHRPGLPDAARRRRHPGCGDRGRQDPGGRSPATTRSGSAACPTRKAWSSWIPAACTGRRGARDRWAGVRWTKKRFAAGAGGDAAHRSRHAGGRGRRPLCQGDGLSQGRVCSPSARARRGCCGRRVIATAGGARACRTRITRFRPTCSRRRRPVRSGGKRKERNWRNWRRTWRSRRSGARTASSACSIRRTAPFTARRSRPRARCPA